MNIFGYILVIITLVITVIIGVKQPPMHTRVMIYDSQYQLVEEKKTPPVETVIKTEELPTMPVENTLTKVQTVIEEQEQKVEPKEVQKAEQRKNAVKIDNKKTTVKENVVQKPEVKTTQKPEVKTVTQTTPQTVTQTTPKTQTVVQTTPQVKTTVQTPAQTVKVLTAQQEEIAWNIWRSNLQNQIMKDTKLPAIPLGTVFKMSFNVDKNGRVSNVQTWSTDSKYTPYAIEFIAPVIKSYQGKAILDFPQGSQRTETTFTGGWKIAQTSKYSTPANYNDIEKVTK